MSRRHVAAPAAMSSRVEILLGTHQVVIEAGEPMETTIAAALRVWAATTDPGNPGAGEAMGFTAPLMVSDPQYQPLMAPEIPLPAQLTPQEEEGVDDRRSTMRRTR